MRRDLLIGLAVAALTVLVYLPVRTHDFIFYDDPQFITENPQIQSGLSWKTIEYAFTTPVAGNWHPVTTLSHALDCQLFGVNPAAQHLINVLIHAANAMLLFLLLQRWLELDAARTRKSAHQTAAQAQSAATGWLPLFVTAVFALHPLRVESVAWIAERKDVLSGLFFLLTLWFYTKFAQGKLPLRMGTENSSQDSNPAWRLNKYYVLALACFALGLMSKPMLVTVPFVLLLLDFWPLGHRKKLALTPTLSPRRGSRNFARPKTWLPGEDNRIIKYSMITEYSPSPGGEGRGEGEPSRTSRGEGEPCQTAWLSLISNASGLILEKVPFLALAAIDCWITLAVQKGAGAMEVIQHASWVERLDNAVVSYLRYLGKLFWPADLAIVYPHPAKHYFLTDQWPAWEVGLGAALLILITALFVLQLRARPYLAVGWFWFLGMMVPVIGLVQVGEQAMADRYTYLPMIGLVIAFAVWVGDMLGEVARKVQGRLLAGWAVATCAIAVILGCATEHQLGFWQNTVTLFEHAAAVTADNASAQFAIGVGLEQQGEIGKAMVHYRVAAAIDPKYTKAFYNMGQLLRKEGKWREAAEEYVKAARFNPADSATQLNLAGVLSRVGRQREAVEHFEQALRLEPNSVEGLNNLAWLLSTCADPSIRDGPRAIQLATRACELTNFKMPVALGTLAAAYAESGRFTEAMTNAQNACSLAMQSGDSNIVSKNQELMKLYAAQKAYREELPTRGNRD